MIKAVFFTSSLMLLLTACGSNENTGQLKSLNKSLELANSIIKEGNRLLVEELRDKEKDPPTHESAAIWLPKAQKINREADSIRALIKELKADLSKEDAAAEKQLCDINGAGNHLFTKLAHFIDSVPER